MNKKTQTIVGVLAIAGLGYYFYMKNTKKPAFANLTSNKKNCKTFPGNIPTTFIGQNVGGGIVQSSGSGTTTLCY